MMERSGPESSSGLSEVISKGETGWSWPEEFRSAIFALFASFYQWAFGGIEGGYRLVLFSDRSKRPVEFQKTVDHPGLAEIGVRDFVSTPTQSFCKGAIG